MLPRVSVIVVTARNAIGLRTCLSSLQRERELLPLEIIVVLNAATDEVASVAAKHEGVTVVNSEVNLGFAGGTNLGAESARGEFVLLFHDDAEGEPGWIAALVGCADAFPGAGAVGSLLEDPDGSMQSAGWILWRDGTTSSAWAGEMPSGAGQDAPFAVDYCSSASLLVRSTTWWAIGGADEDFYPAYYVDVDVAMAIRERDEAVLCEPRSRVRHACRAREDLGFRAFVADRNRARFLEKWPEAVRRQLPRDTTPAGLERARAHAASMAAPLTVGARTSSADSRPGKTVLATERPSHACRHLRREVKLKDAWIGELTRKRHELRAEVDALRVELEALRQHESELLAERASQAEWLAWLQEREATLQRIESGGWWRLRRRVLPLIRVWQWTRRLWARGN